MKLRIAYILIVSIGILGASCAGLKPYHTERVETNVKSEAFESLQNLPAPSEKIVAAVYRFRDQTGQYQPSQQSISYSTAVTQGATSILIKSMENSGWFTPIEREGISNLLNERRIIQSTRQQNNDNTPLPPLLFAGIVLEGGIIGYDSNVITGGAGVRYLGMDASGQFRKDQVTIYLRAVSTSSGRVLKTVHTTKSILSQEMSGGVFRYVGSNKLLESEIGVTFNEPAVMAVTEAIDEAVKQLIITGVDDGLWQPADQQAFTTYRTQFQLAIAEKNEEYDRDYFGLTHRPNLRKGMALSANLSFGSYIGSYGDETYNSGLMMHVEQWLASPFSLKANFHRSRIGSEAVFSAPVTNAEIVLNSYLMPGFKLSPYAGLGGGVLAFDSQQKFNDNQYYATVTGEAGFDYRFIDDISFRIGVNYRYLISDEMDGVKLGTVHDQQWNIVTGLSFNL